MPKDTCRDLRNQSRDFPSCGTQRLLDLGLNGFGLELFVESWWDTLEKIGDGLTEEQRRLSFTYRGVEITIDPKVGFDLWERPAVDEPPETVEMEVAAAGLNGMLARAGRIVARRRARARAEEEAAEDGR